MGASVSHLSPTASQTRQNLKEAFWRLYKEKKIEKITISEICTVAGYNRSTFYAYFQDIYDILNAIESELIRVDDFKGIIVNNLIENNFPERVLRDLLALFEKCDEYFSILLGENGDPRFRDKLFAQLTPAFSDLSPQGFTKTQQYALAYQNAGMILTITKWYENGKDIPIEGLIKVLLDLTCHGTQTVLKKEFSTDVRL